MKKKDLRCCGNCRNFNTQKVRCVIKNRVNNCKAYCKLWEFDYCIVISNNRFMTTKSKVVNTYE